MFTTSDWIQHCWTHCGFLLSSLYDAFTVLQVWMEMICYSLYILTIVDYFVQTHHTRLFVLGGACPASPGVKALMMSSLTFCVWSVFAVWTGSLIIWSILTVMCRMSQVPGNKGNWKSYGVTAFLFGRLEGLRWNCKSLKWADLFEGGQVISYFLGAPPFLNWTLGSGRMVQSWSQTQPTTSSSDSPPSQSSGLLESNHGFHYASTKHT